jgi:hypothetical protein
MKWSLSLAGLLVFAAISASASGFSFEFVHEGLVGPSHIETRVQFDGTAAKCIVDTGARFTIVQLPLLAGSPKAGEIVGGGVSGVQSATDLVQSRVQAGEWVLEDTIVGRKQPGTLPAICLLGNDFFLQREFSIDFKATRFSDETEFQGTLFPLNQFKADRGGQFGFNLEIQGEQVSALFDTGATSTVFDATFVKNHPENFEFIREFSVQEGSNQNIKAGIYRAKSIKFGNQEDRNVEVYVVDLTYLQSKIPGVQVVLGLSQMTSRKWYINNMNSTWGVYGD